MTWTQRLRLFGGIFAVLALTAVLVLVFNQRQAQALSTTGQVVSAQASVGAAYGGVITTVEAAVISIAQAAAAPASPASSRLRMAIAATLVSGE